MHLVRCDVCERPAPADTCERCTLAARFLRSRPEEALKHIVQHGQGLRTRFIHVGVSAFCGGVVFMAVLTMVFR